ncbi:MAG: hypothetical protein ABMA15_10370 [Vicinamibacterales bacterium]
MRLLAARVAAWALAAVSIFGAPLVASASGPIDPRLQFRQLRTAHFTIYFHQNEEALARRLAAISEETRTRVGDAMHVTPPLHTHVVLADQSESANGWASPLPRDTVFLNAAAPSGAEFIGKADDWLRVLFTHEYTHIVHLDRSNGWARIARGLFGRTELAFPNLSLPQWQIEGLAAWQESALTGAGRVGAADFRAIERVAAADGHPLRLDQSNGGLTTWPDGHAAYAAGVGFHEYLVGRFGDAALGQLADATARRLPFLASGAFKGIYGESLGSLWRGYTRELLARAASMPRAANGLVPLAHARSAVISGPRFAPPNCAGCAEAIVYSVQSPDGFPSLRIVEQNGTGDRRLTTRYLGSTLGASAEVLVFDQQELRRNVGLYSDLYALDRRTGDVRRLTTESRLQDPDLSPDGQSVVATRARGDRRELVLVHLHAADGLLRPIAATDIETLATESSTDYSAPRWSPSGRLIAVERRRLGALPGVVVLDVATKRVTRELADSTARIVTPTWSPDEAAVVASADFNEESFDIYEFELDAGHRVRRLTQTAGALWPDVRRDGSLLAFAGYTADGYGLFTVPYASRSEMRGAPPAVRPPPAPFSPASNADAAAAAAASSLGDSGYSPLGTLAPTAWTPVLFNDADGTRVGGFLSGADVLGRHVYTAGLDWLVNMAAVERSPGRRTPDWNASYAYTRWRPSLFASAGQQTQVEVVVNRATSAASAVAVVQRQLQMGVLVPIAHVRQSTQVLASVLRTEDHYLLADSSRTTTLVSARAGLSHNTARYYGYSISREHGVSLGATVERATRVIGSHAEATTSTVDGRAFLPGLGLHHVVALRGAAGVSRGEDLARQRFGLGATSASPSVLDFGGDALGLLRAGGGSLVAGSSIAVANMEYRFPLARIERGLGTWPLFLKWIHASVFADVARVSGSTASSRAWRRAEGGELSLGGVAGYALPFTASAGVAWGQDSRGSYGPTAYVRLGHSF